MASILSSSLAKKAIKCISQNVKLTTAWGKIPRFTACGSDWQTNEQRVVLHFKFAIFIQTLLLQRWSSTSWYTHSFLPCMIL